MGIDAYCVKHVYPLPLLCGSGDFHSILTICLDTGFMRLVDRLADYFRPTPTENGVIIK